MLSLFRCMDNAHAAEKMYDWSNLGNENLAWATGPYISAPANERQISHTHPYVLRVSESHSLLTGYQLGPKPVISENGGVKLAHDSDLNAPTEIIPTVSVIFQFAILEAFDFDSFSDYTSGKRIDENDFRIKRYDRRPVKDRLDVLRMLTGKSIENNLENAYKSVSAFRNVLTHEPHKLCSDPKVAFDVYSVCQAIAFSLAEILEIDVSTSSISHRVKYWRYRLDAFHEEMTFS
jgi:hypothetical protein